MKEKRFLILMGVLSLIFVLASMPFIGACAQPGPAPAAPTAEPIELKMSTSWPPTASGVKASMPIFEEIEKATGGRVKIVLYTGGALGKGPAHHDMVLNRVTDIGLAPQAYTAGVFPLTSVIELPFIGYTSSQHATRVLWGLYRKFPELRAEYADTKVLALWTTDLAGLHMTKKPAYTLDDIKGLKLRGTGEVQAEMIKLFGATPVSMPVMELYSSLEKGVIDGTFFGTLSTIPWKLIEVCKYSTIGNFYLITQFLLMNQDSWDALPKDIQNQIDDVIGEKAALTAAWTGYDALYEGSLVKFKEAGVQRYELPPAELAKWKDAISPIYGNWIKDKEAKGLPGKAILDEAFRLAEEYKE